MKTMGVEPERECRKRRPATILLACFAAISGAGLRGQDNPEIRQIIERLDRLEKQNAELLDEVRRLREQLSAPAAAASTGQTQAAHQQSISDQLAVQQARIDEQAQAKVEAEHKLPLRITGMVLFNAYENSNSAGIPYGTAALTPGPASAGGTLSQSIFGLEYYDPDAILGATVHGAVYLDLSGNTGANANAAYAWPIPRLRTGTISIDWPSQSVTAGVDKPLISPYAPDSLAQVALPPLSGAGNLWLWQPQVRFEQRVRFSDEDTLHVQAALYQTQETYGVAPLTYPLEAARPAWEGRFQYEHRRSYDSRFSIAPGFHFSTSHVAGQSVNSQILSLDGQAQFARMLGLSGTFFTGENLAGVGGVGPGFTIGTDYIARPVRGNGGWLQLTVKPLSRVTLHFFGGEQRNKPSDVPYDSILTNAAWAGNVYYQLAPNVFGAFEWGQTRTDWMGDGERLRNLYELSLAYMF